VAFFRECPVSVSLFCGLFDRKYGLTTVALTPRVKPGFSVERPMRIELVVDPSKPLPLASRVAPAAKAAAAAAK